MARPKSTVPALRCHISGNAICQVDGVTYYLGKHGSPESLSRYAVLIREYQANGLKVPEWITSQTLVSSTDAFSRITATVNESEQPIRLEHVTEAFKAHIREYFKGEPRECQRICKICDDIAKHDGKMLAVDYGPKALKQQRQRWVDSGKSRIYCNRLVGLVVRMFKWAVAEELASVEAWQRLKSLEPLREGYTDARENREVRPVAIEHVRATAAHLSPTLKAMLRIHVATGMRPSELCEIRPCDIDRSTDVWVYRPANHKNKKRGKTRAIPIVGDAREAIVDYLNRKASSYCFSPAETTEWRRAQQRAARKGYGSYKRTKTNPQWKPRAKYDARTYGQAIRRAAESAKVPHWHPYQLRHLALTLVRNALGPEAAQALGGHANLKMTEHYARVSELKAIEAAQHAPKL